MGIISFIVCIILLIVSIVINKNKRTINPLIFFYLLWSFVLLLSNLNFYNIKKASFEAYFLIFLMLIFFMVGYILSKKIKSKNFLINFKNKFKEITKKTKKKRVAIFYIISTLIIILNIIDIIILIREIRNGVPMWKIRNWQLEPFGKENPFYSRRTFVEELVRALICAPFQVMLPPIAFYCFLYLKDKAKKIRVIITLALVIISTSVASGGGRLGIIYAIMSFLLLIYIFLKDKNISVRTKKIYKKILYVVLIISLVVLIGYTTIRTGKGNFFKQIYKYFAISPSMLTIWLTKIQSQPMTFGFSTFFGIHTYFFRIFETLKFNFLVPTIYQSSFQNILSAEKFIDIGFGNANAFVTPIYYFMLDGGYPFVCIASAFFGFIVQKCNKKYDKEINIKNFTLYSLMMYAVFLSFIRIQTTSPAFILAIVFSLILIDENDVQFSKEKRKLKTNNDLISIVIPMYNVEKYVERCIKSVLDQDYKNIEIIMVDDGSPDSSSKICEKYMKIDNRIKLIHKENGGLSSARNAGIDIATGKYITFIDSDDYVEKNYISELYDTLLRSNADMSISGHNVWYGEECIEKATYEDFSSSPINILYKILYDDGVDLSAWGKLYKTEICKEIKFPEGRVFEDSATTYKYVDKCNIIAVNSIPTYNYIIRSNSISTSNFSMKKMDLIVSTKEMTDYIRKKYPRLKRACDRRLMYAYLSTITQYAKSKDKNETVENELMRYIKQNKINILKDIKVPIRDKIGILSLSFGIKFYKIIWRIYSIKTGRK